MDYTPKLKNKSLTLNKFYYNHGFKRIVVRNSQDAIILDIIKKARELENELAKLGASGIGLKQKAQSVQGKLGAKTMADLKNITLLRNKVAHEAGSEISTQEKRKFNASFKSAQKQIELLLKAQRDVELARLKKLHFSRVEKLISLGAGLALDGIILFNLLSKK